MSLNAKKNAQCVRQKKQLYHLKNNYKQSTCLASEPKTSKILRVVRFKCDDNRLEMQWIKQESTGTNIKDAFHICQSLNDKITCLSDSPKNLNNAGNSFVPLGISSYMKSIMLASKYQQWRLNTKTNQIVNLQTRLCLISFDSKSLSNTSVVTLLSGVDVCNAKSEVTMEQKWSLNPLPKC